MSAEPLLVLTGCSRCLDARPDGLYGLTVLGRLCWRCWRELGQPPSRWPEATIEERHQAELRVRERMLARGGNDRYMVRSGKAGL